MKYQKSMRIRALGFFAFAASGCLNIQIGEDEDTDDGTATDGGSGTSSTSSTTSTTTSASMTSASTSSTTTASTTMTAGTSTTTSTTSTTGTVDPCDGNNTVGGTVNLIDDFEHLGSVDIPTVDGREGDWYWTSDGSAGGTTAPATPEPTDTEGYNGTAGLLVSADGFTETWGVQVGVRLNNPIGTCAHDASAFDGIEFWVKSNDATSQTIVIQGQTRAVIPVEDGGTCTGTCYDAHVTTFSLTDGAWTQVQIPWSDFAQGGWGDAVAFDPADLANFTFGVGTDPGGFDLTLDDFSFMGG